MCKSQWETPPVVNLNLKMQLQSRLRAYKWGLKTRAPLTLHTLDVSGPHTLGAFFQQRKTLNGEVHTSKTLSRIQLFVHLGHQAYANIKIHVL